MPTARSALPRTNRAGISSARTSARVSCGSGAPCQIAAEDDEVRPLALDLFEDRRERRRIAVHVRERGDAHLPVGSTGDRELVLGVLDPLLELPAVGRRLARLDALELGLRLLELLRARGRRRSPSRLTASSTSASARSCSTLKKPGPGRELEHFGRALTWTRVEPAFSIAISGACRASTPISPAAPGTISISASPSNAAPVRA